MIPSLEYDVWPNILLGHKIININRTKTLSDYFNHPSKQFFLKSKQIIPNIPIVSTNYHALIYEYIDTLIQTVLFGYALYFSLSIISYFYFYIWNKKKYLPKWEGSLKDIFGEIKFSVLNVTVEAFLVAGLRMLIPRYSMIYFEMEEYGILYFLLSIVLHVIFDETCTYWIHRWLHTYKFLYDHLHYIHHKFIDITPFCGFAFHPLDAFFQAIPTFTSCFIFPIHNDLILVWSIMTTAWAISIHDNVPVLPCKLFLYSTHHTIHHEKGLGKYKNYGKFTSIWDRYMGSYMDPDRIDFGFENPRKDTFKEINQTLKEVISKKTNKKKL